MFRSHRANCGCMLLTCCCCCCLVRHGTSYIREKDIDDYCPATAIRDSARPAKVSCRRGRRMVLLCADDDGRCDASLRSARSLFSGVELMARACAVCLSSVLSWALMVAHRVAVLCRDIRYNLQDWERVCCALLNCIALALAWSCWWDREKEMCCFWSREWIR